MKRYWFILVLLLLSFSLLAESQGLAYSQNQIAILKRQINGYENLTQNLQASLMTVSRQSFISKKQLTSLKRKLTLLNTELMKVSSSLEKSDQLLMTSGKGLTELMQQYNKLLILSQSLNEQILELEKIRKKMIIGMAIGIPCGIIGGGLIGYMIGITTNN